MDFFVEGFVFRKHPLLGTVTLLCAELDSALSQVGQEPGQYLMTTWRKSMKNFENVAVKVIFQSPACLRKAVMIH